MASYGQSVTLSYQAWNTSTNAYVTGDSGNHTLRLIKDGTSSAPTNSPSENDATNTPGVYKLVLTATECQAKTVTLAGKSSTANVVIIPITISFEILTDIADGILDRDMATGTDSGGRTVRNALRFLRNKFSVSGTTLTVTKEDDTTTAWTSTLTTDSAATPITGSDPA